MGELACLNVAGGDIKISFDTNNAAEAIRARRIITEMLKRGYALLVEHKGKYQRATAFDEKKGEYIIADYDPTVDEEETDEHEQGKKTKEPQPTIKKGVRGRKRIPMEKTNAVSVAPSSGG